MSNPVEYGINCKENLYLTATQRVNQTFYNLLTLLHRAYISSLHVQNPLKEFKTVLEDKGNEVFSWLKRLYNGKYILPFTIVYIFLMFFVI